jgi:predicted DNA-binding transcriptional regulator AlpA
MATIVSPTANTGPEAVRASYDARDLAQRLKCSVRHIWRMSDAGKLPPAIRLGAVVRWDAAVIEAWIARGCPPVLKGGHAR